MTINSTNKTMSTRREIGRALVAAGGLVAMPHVARAQTSISMKIGTPTLNDAQHEWMKLFAATVEQNSKGAIKPELYPASQLGQAPRMIEGTQLGSIQMIVMPPEFLSGVDTRYEVLGAPGVFKDIGHAQRCLLAPEFNKEFLSIGDAKGLTGVGLYINAQMVVNCRTRLDGIADVAKKKIRVLGSAMQTEQIKRLGGVGVPMALGEVLPAVQQGTIDGVLGSLPVMAALRFYDASKYILETEHATITVISLASRLWMEKLPTELRTIILDAGQKASRDIYDWAIVFNEKQRKVWTDNGGEIVTLSPAEHEKLMGLMRPIGPEVASRKPAEKSLFDLITKIAAATA